MMNDRLGRGLSALIPGSDEQESNSAGLTTLPIEQISPNRYQPRKSFDQQKLIELSESIRENGIIQPIIVTKTANSGYELIAGERRLEAAKLAGMDRIPVVIRSVSRKEQLQLAIIENVQRENLNPIDEALAYRLLIDDFELTHNDVAQKMGKDRATITNSLRLLNLPTAVQNMVNDGSLSAGHARAVLSVDTSHQCSFAEFIVKYKLTVRQAEDKAKNWINDLEAKQQDKQQKSSLIRSIERDLSSILRVKTTIRESKGKGKISLEFNNSEELELLKNKLYSLK